VSVWLVLAAAALGTFALRASMVVLWGRWTPPAWFDQSTRLVAPAMLCALVAAALTPAGTPKAVDLARLGVVAVGFVVARRTGSFGATLAAGLAAWWALELSPLST
jgi:branched-subunit amino acid transport protein